MMVKKNIVKNRPKVLVALSGGVDSAVSAYLLKKQGYDVTGAHMVCWDEGPYCNADLDRATATKVASYLNIPFQVFDYRAEYKQAVVDYFVSEYEAGLTPNPDVACNREIKFGVFFKKALELGFDYIATGHYVRVEKYQVASIKNQNGQEKSPITNLQLLAGVDQTKDQSYFLYTLKQEQLAKTIFPIGHLTKGEVRKIATSIGLPNAARKDSQGICFIGDVEIREFLRERVRSRIGNIVNSNGRVLGRHEGLAYYTIGQREGLGISEKIPHYVVAKNPVDNKLIVAPLGDDSHFGTRIQAQNVNWIDTLPKVGSRIQARIRYRQPLFEAKVEKVSHASATIICFEAQKAVTQGQSLVFYKDSEIILGGGVIV